MSTGGWLLLAGAGAVGAYLVVTKLGGSSGAAGAAAGPPAASGGILSKIGGALSTRGPGTYHPSLSSLKPSNFVAQHVARKDSIAPYVLGKFGVPASIAGPVSSVASKLDVSGYVEQKVGGTVGGWLGKIGI